MESCCFSGLEGGCSDSSERQLPITQRQSAEGIVVSPVPGDGGGGGDGSSGSERLVLITSVKYVVQCGFVFLVEVLFYVPFNISFMICGTDFYQALRNDIPISLFNSSPIQKQSIQELGGDGVGDGGLHT